MLQGIIVTIFFNSDRLDASVHMEITELDLREDKRMYQVTPEEDERRAEDNGTNDSEVEWSKFEVAVAPVGREDLQHIAAHPHVCLILALVPVDPNCEAIGHKDPEEIIVGLAGAITGSVSV